MNKPGSILVYLALMALPTGLIGQVELAVPVTVDSASSGMLYFTYSPLANDQDELNGQRIILAEPGEVAVLFSGFRAEGFSKNESISALFDFSQLEGLRTIGATFLDASQGKFLVSLNAPESKKYDTTVRLRVRTPAGMRKASFRFTQQIEVAAQSVTTVQPKEREPKSVAKGDLSPPDSLPASAPVKEEEPAQAEPLRVVEKVTALQQEQPELTAKTTRATSGEIAYTETQVGQEHTFIFDEVEELLVTVSDPSGIKILEDAELGDQRHRVVLETQRAGLHRIEVRDAARRAQGNPMGISIDNRLSGSFEESPEKLVFSKLSGGIPPYKLLLYRGDEYVASLDSISIEGLEIPKEDLSAYATAGGVFSVRMIDANSEGDFYFAGQTFSLNPVTEASGNSILPMIFGGLGIAGLLLVLLTRKQGAKRKNLERVRQDLSDQAEPAVEGKEAPSQALTSNTPLVEPQPIIPDPGPVAAVEVEPEQATITSPQEIDDAPAPAVFAEDKTEEAVNAEEPLAKKTAMRISRRVATNRPKLPFRPDLFPGEYVSLGMSEHWDLSMVTSVHIGAAAFEELNGFLRQENTDKIKATEEDRARVGWERNEDVPEIGGMLMGQYQRIEERHAYQISLEKFVPLEASYQNAVKVDFDPVSLARDLGDAQDENPDLAVLGWFHTHPGHGLFLSRPDLLIHHSHFRKPYHIAMEIDSLSERLDTGIFTYTPSGQMNNTYSFRTGRSWFSWKEIEKQARP